jgi:hypothetical protein
MKALQESVLLPLGSISARTDPDHWDDDFQPDLGKNYK